jgi:Cation/multidrug efflux pump
MDKRRSEISRLRGNILADFSIREPVFITMVMVSILLLGIYSFVKLPIALLPSSSLPTIAMVVAYPGASPEMIADTVVKPIEDQISTLDDLDSITSTSYDDFALIIIQFDTGIDLNATQQRLQDRVGMIRATLPVGVLDPIFTQYGQTDLPILLVAVNSTGDRSPEALYQLLKDTIAPEVQSAQGVGSVTVFGGKERQINVDLDLARLQALRIPPAEVSAAIAAANSDIGLGSIVAEGQEYKLRASSVFTNVQDIAQVALSVTGYSVGDVATIRDGRAEDSSYSRLNGVDTVVLAITRQSSANTNSTAQAALAKLDSVFEQHPDLVYNVIMNQAEEVEMNVNGALEDIMIAIFFAVLVVWFFFRNLRNTMVTVIGLPIIVAGTFISMYLLGLSLNIVTLLALSVSVGLVIDDAIVVRENVFRNLEMGYNPIIASSRGAHQVASSVISMTLTIIAVFLTVLDSPGLPGVIYHAFAVTVIAAMLVSLLEAFTNGPMLSAYWLKRPKDAPPPPPDDLEDDVTQEKVEETRLMKLYERTLELALRFRGTVLVATVLLLAWTVVVALSIPISFLPIDENGQFGVSFEMPPGTPLAESDAKAREVEAILAQDPDVTNVLTIVGAINGPEYVYFFVTHKGKNLDTVQARLRPLLADYPRITFGQTSYEFSTVTLVATRPIQVQIRSSLPHEQIAPYAERLQAAFASVEGLEDLDSSYTPGVPRLTYRINQTIAQQYGFTNLSLVSTLRILVSGLGVGEYRENGSAYPINVRLRPEDRQTIAGINSLGIPFGSDLVPLDSIARSEVEYTQKSVLRSDRLNEIILGGNNVGRNLNYVVSDMQKIIDQNPPPEGISVKFGGSFYNQQQQGYSSLFVAILIAIVLIYIVLVVAFRSFTEPIVLMVAMPLSLIGAVFSARIMQLDLNVVAMVGVLMLLGLVVKNSIMLLEYTKRLLEAGMSTHDALVRACLVRTRPIMMTSAAIIFGNLPTALGLGAGAELRRGLGIVIIGGMISSTILTLFIVPTTYSFYASLMSRFGPKHTDDVKHDEVTSEAAAPADEQASLEPDTVDSHSNSPSDDQEQADAPDEHQPKA